MYFSHLDELIRQKKDGSRTSRVPSLVLVPMAGLEPARLAPLPPQDSVSTNFTTSAKLLSPKPD
jgi:hypothetical protein